MDRKRRRAQRAIPKDLRAQRRVLRRSKDREGHRVMPLLHQAVNELLAKVGDRNIVVEDLSNTTEELERRTLWTERRRRLGVWTHGQFTRLVSHKARTVVVRVNARGTSSECPRCGGPLAHPEWRRRDVRELPGRMASGSGGGDRHPDSGSARPTGSGPSPERAQRAPGGGGLASGAGNGLGPQGRACEGRRREGRLNLECQPEKGVITQTELSATWSIPPSEHRLPERTPRPPP